MKKYLWIFIMFLSLLLSSCVYYKPLSDDENIILMSNPTKSVIFLVNNEGYSTSNRFVLQTQKNDKQTIKEAKLYKGHFEYSEISDSNNYQLLDDYNGLVFYINESGLQGLTYEEKVSDIAYNYKLNGFNELIKYYGTDEYISLFEDSSTILPGILDKDICYAAALTETIKTRFNESTDVIKKNIYIYEQNNALYINKEKHTKHIEKKDQDNPTYVEDNYTKQILSNVDVKKAFVIDNTDYSVSVILDKNNEIYVVDNTDLSVKQTNIYSNILTFNQAKDLFYLINNNTLYVLDKDLNVINQQDFEQQIVGSSFFYNQGIPTIKVALLQRFNEIVLVEIKLPIPEKEDILI